MLERLKFIRKKLNLSQHEFADKLEVHFNTVSKYERGESKPTSDFLSKLSEVFGVNINYLLTGQGEPFLEDSEQKADSKTQIVRVTIPKDSNIKVTIDYE